MAQVGRLAKESMVQELAAQLKARPNVFVAGVGRLSAVEADTLRKQLHGMQARVLMIKRRLGLQGLAALKINGGISQLLDGSVALVFPGEDLIPAAKLLAEFAKHDQQRLTVRGGLVDGQLLDARQFEEFAHLPSRPRLIAQLIGVMESPLADVVFTVERVLGDVAWILEEASQKNAQGGTHG